MRQYLYPFVFVVIIAVFFYKIFLGLLPIPSDTLVGLYHPWRDIYATEYPRGIPFKNFLVTDPIRQQIPWRKVAIDQWKQGQIPWWNPFTFSGAPLAANIQAAVFYPLNIFFFVFSFPVAWTILIVVQPLLAGLFLFAYLLHKRLHPASSLLGAVAWSFSGFSVSWLTWGTIMQTALWLPLVLLSLEKIKDGAKNWWLILTLGLTMQLLAGHAQIALYSMIFAGVYWFVFIRGHAKDIAKAIILFIFLTSIQWWPLLMSMRSSARVAESVWLKDGFFIPWQHLIQFVVPDFFGNPATLNYWGTWNWAEFAGYIGIAPLLFVGIAISSDWKRAKFWAFTIIIALLLALPTGIAKLPYGLHIPVISVLQPTRLIVIIDLCLAVLAALGMNTYMKKSSKVSLALVVVGVIILIAWLVTIPGGENFLVSRRNLFLPTGFFIVASTALFIGHRFQLLRFAVVVFLLCVTVFDLLRFGWKFTPFTSIEYFFPETGITQFLQAQPKPFRIMSVDVRIMPPNVSAYYGIETIEGYDPIYSAEYEKLFATVANMSVPYGFNRILTTKNIDSPLLPQLNVRFVLSLEDISRPFLTKVFQEGETRVYEYTSVGP